MKLDLHGIRFRIWITVLGLTTGVLIALGILQIGLIRPYYRNTKINSVKIIADAIETDLIKNNDDNGINLALQQAVDNNVCVVIYNSHGQQIYDADSLGTGCIFNSVYAGYESTSVYNSGVSLIDLVNNSEGEYSANFNNERTSLEMIVYGRKISENLANYYLFVNAELEPVDSVISFFTRQYAQIVIIVFVFASMIAIAISRSLANPIVAMNREAKKLADADYGVRFDGGNYSETRNLAGTLNEAKNKLARIDEMRRDLIANVSHDIRTPLTDIRAYAEMIRDISGNDESKREKHLNVIIRETDYMNNLVNDMSELTQLQSGSYQLNYMTVDLVSSIRDIAEINEGLLTRHNLSLRLDIPESLPVWADEIKIEQVIFNYLSNAVKHSPAGTEIKIRAFRNPGQGTARVEVIDHGLGISDEDLPYIWDRYEKTSKSFSRTMTNTGLGLSIVKAIIETHGGSYGVNTKKGEGSTFWFELKEKKHD